MSVLSYAKPHWGICKCGHYEWMHDDASMDHKGDYHYVGQGHGACGAAVETEEMDEYDNPVNVRCKCKQYTWVKSIPNPHPPVGVVPRKL